MWTARIQKKRGMAKTSGRNVEIIGIVRVSLLTNPCRLSRIACTLVHVYHIAQTSTRYAVERVQTGVRIEKRSLKVMKAPAEYHDLTLGDLIEESSCTRLTAHARLGRKA